MPTTADNRPIRYDFSAARGSLAPRGFEALQPALAAAIQGTSQAYAHVQRPTADIRVSQLDEYAIGQVLQMFMLATVLEGRLLGINPYGQPGVEAYKKNMGKILGL